MTKRIIPVVAALGLMVLTGCKEKKQTQDIIATKQEEVKLQDPIRMQEYRQEQTVDWNGRSYRVAVVRTPVDSLPMVQDEVGQKYVDNRISLTITRQDQTVLLSKQFTKASFHSYLNDDYRQKGVLEAMVFDEVDDGELEFAVSVAHPQSEDEYIPLKLSVRADGGISIKRDSDLDTHGEENE